MPAPQRAEFSALVEEGSLAVIGPGAGVTLRHGPFVMNTPPEIREAILDDRRSDCAGAIRRV
jgi:redox-sensitive bicupin YhaK (pirin superfamily)